MCKHVMNNFMWLGWESAQPSSLAVSFLRSQTHLAHRNVLVNAVQKRQILSLKESPESEIRFPNTGHVLCMTLDKIDEVFLLCGSTANQVMLYDMRKGVRHPLDERRTINPVRNASLDRGRHGLVSAVDWFPNDCGIFVAASINGSVSLFDTARFQCVTTFPFDGKRVFESKFRPLCANGLRSLIGVALERGEIALCDVRTGDNAQSLRAHSMDTTALDWSPLHENQLLSASRDGTVKVWDIRRGSNATPVLTLDWAQDKGFVAPCAAGDQHQHWLHHKVHREISQARAHEREVLSARFSPCGMRIITSAADGVRIWSREGVLASTKYAMTVRRKMPYRLDIASFSCPADDLLVLPGASSKEQDTRKAVSLVPVCSGVGKAVRVLHGHCDDVECAVYSRHTQRFISSSKDGMLLEWCGADLFDHQNATRVNSQPIAINSFCEKQSGLWIKSQSTTKPIFQQKNAFVLQSQPSCPSLKFVPPLSVSTMKVKDFKPLPQGFVPPILLQFRTRRPRSPQRSQPAIENNDRGEGAVTSQIRKRKVRRLLSNPKEAFSPSS